MGRRVGIFGGTFDPPHIGHLVMATQAAHQCDLEVVVLMVANDPWQKASTQPITPAEVRLEMTRAAVEGSARLVAGDAEIRRGGPTYTLDTLREWRAGHPDDELVLVMGADAAAGLEGWHRAGEIAAEATIAVVGRPGVDLAAVLSSSDRWDIDVVDAPLVDLSSTDIRRRAREGAPLDFLVPSGVLDVIDRHGLYGDRVRSTPKVV